MNYENILKKEFTSHNFQIHLKMELGNLFDSYENDGALINGKEIFLFTRPNIIKIYDCITLKKIYQFELPITPIKYEITNNNHILIYNNHILYCYFMDFSDGKLIFKFFVPDIFLFKYLKERKEILIQLKKAQAFSRINLEGIIQFCGSNDLKVYFNINEIDKEKNKDTEYDYIDDAYLPSSYYRCIYGFDKDKYILKFFGYCLSSGDPYDDYNEEYYNISIYNTDKMEEIYSNDISYYLGCKKLTDNLFTDIDGNEPIFFYNNTEKKIIFLENVLNGKYFSLYNENKIVVFVKPNIAYIIDFEKEIKKCITLKENYDDYNVLKIGYYCDKGKEYLFLLINNEKYQRQIIKGQIL